MIHTSEPLTTPPAEYKTPLQQQVYLTLERLGIPFTRIDCDPAVTMEDCQAIDRALSQHTVKTILLCNRQQTRFYLFVTRGDKPFVTRDFSGALGISRVSFAPAERLLELCGTEVGATTILSAILPSSADVEIVIDRDVTLDPVYGCTDGTTTSYMRLDTAAVLDTLLPALRRKYTVITV